MHERLSLFRRVYFWVNIASLPDPKYLLVFPLSIIGVHIILQSCCITLHPRCIVHSCSVVTDACWEYWIGHTYSIKGFLLCFLYWCDVFCITIRVRFDWMFRCSFRFSIRLFKLSFRLRTRPVLRFRFILGRLRSRLFHHFCGGWWSGIHWINKNLVSLSISLSSLSSSLVSSGSYSMTSLS